MTLRIVVGASAHSKRLDVVDVAVFAAAATFWEIRTLKILHQPATVAIELLLVLHVSLLIPKDLALLLLLLLRL